MMKKTISLLLGLMMLLTAACAFADDSDSKKEDGFSTSCTYNYDYWGDVLNSPDPYRVEAVIDSPSLGLDKLENKRISKPQGIFVRDTDIYIKSDTKTERRP